MQSDFNFIFYNNYYLFLNILHKGRWLLGWTSSSGPCRCIWILINIVIPMISITLPGTFIIISLFLHRRRRLLDPEQLLRQPRIAIRSSQRQRSSPNKGSRHRGSDHWPWSRVRDSGQGHARFWGHHLSTWWNFCGTMIGERKWRCDLVNLFSLDQRDLLLPISKMVVCFRKFSFVMNSIVIFLSW